MPETAVGSFSSGSAPTLYPESGIEEDQSLGPDVFTARARDARGRFAKGHSGNPRGRPPGIRNPRRRLPDLVARPMTAEALAAFLDRKPQLLRPLAQLWAPPPRSALEPAERIGIDMAAVQDPKQVLAALQTVLVALAAGEFSPRDVGRILVGLRARLRAWRKLTRSARRPGARKSPPRPAGAR